MNYVANAFSLNMIPERLLWSVRFAPLQQVLSLQSRTSIVGHADTARVLGVAFNRSSVTLTEKDTVLIMQYSGPRLPEGATELPEGASFTPILMYFKEPCGC